MSNKCPFCGKGNVIINVFFGKYCKEAPPNLCLNCGYTWGQENIESSCGLDINGTLPLVRGDLISHGDKECSFIK